MVDSSATLQALSRALVLVRHTRSAQLCYWTGTLGSRANGWDQRLISVQPRGLMISAYQEPITREQRVTLAFITGFLDSFSRPTRPRRVLRVVRLSRQARLWAMRNPPIHSCSA